MSANTLYINSTSVSPGTTTTLTPLPRASTIERRNTSLVPIAKAYSLAITRSQLQGVRTIPIFMPMLVPAQLNNAPFVRGLTPYSTTLKMDVYKGASTFSVPAAGITCTYYLDVCTFDSMGNAMLPWTPLLISFLTTATTTYGQMQIALDAAFSASPDPIIQKITTSFTSANQILFTCALPANSGTYKMTVNLFGDSQTPSTLPSQAQAFGFPNFPVGTNGLEYVQTSNSTTMTMTLPNAAFYQLPQLVTTQSASQAIIWQSQTGQDIPDAPDKTFYSDSSALWTYDIQWFVGLYNASLLGAYNKVVAQCRAAGCPIAPLAPFLTFTNNVFNLNVDVSTVVSQQMNGTMLNVVSGTVNIVMTMTLSQTLQDLLLLPVIWSPDRSSAVVQFEGATSSSSTPGFTVLSCDFYPTDNMWNPVSSIVFLSSLLPTRNEITSAPIDVTANTTVTESNSATMLSDTVPVQSSGQNIVSTETNYQPIVWRWEDLIGDGPINAYDLQYGWRNRFTGFVNPILLNPGASTAIKIAMTRV